MTDILDPENNSGQSVVTDPQSEPSQQPNIDLQDQKPDQDQQQDDRPSREERRAQNLANKLREANQRRTPYEDDLRQRSSNQSQQGPNYNDPNLSVDILQRDREQYGMSQYERGRQEAMNAVDQRFFQENLERDTEALESRYAQLNPDSEDYDQALVEDINSAYLDAIGFDQNTGAIRNPSVRFKDYASKFMKIATRYADSASADAARNVATQASRTGVRPNSPARRTNIGELQPGDISNMDSATYEKNRSAIDAQIKRQLGI